MYNEISCSVNCGNAAIDRSNWNQVSNRAKKDLYLAKEEFNKHVMKYSFENISDTQYEFYKEHAIKIHLVERMRPKFNEYVQSFGAKPKWVRIYETEKVKYRKYEHRSGSIYFCNLTMGRQVKENLIGEFSLYTFLTAMCIDVSHSLGWIAAITKKQLPIPNIQYDVKVIAIPMSAHYQKNSNRKSEMQTFESATTIARRPQRKVRKTYESLRNLCSSDDDEDNDDNEYVPEPHKKRRVNF